ncbi:metallophosphoesterase [Devosia sp.]|uniref:metallophosphoesterase n=1 Tax=Devosia sp. TaxID=1871048 RepID=UPI003BAD75ED
MLLKNLIDKLTGAISAPAEPMSAHRLSFDADPAALYAIGDVHGCLDLLRSLERQIADDAAQLGHEAWVILLGDVIDRGPASAQVLDHLLNKPPAGLRRFCLGGNHEAMMLEFMARPRRDSDWLAMGGRETLLSYGIPGQKLLTETSPRAIGQLLESYIPEEHRIFLDALPVLIETPTMLFSHAGLRPGIPIEKQSTTDLQWFRDGFADDFAEFGKIVVHGHTPREQPLVTAHRISIDTGASNTGRLTAVRLIPGQPPLIFTAAAGFA